MPDPITVLRRLAALDMPEHVAARYIRYGRVRVDGRVVTDPRATISRTAIVEIKTKPRAWRAAEGEAVA